LNISYSSDLTCTFTGTSPGNNGNVYELQNQLNDARSQNFTYDSLNRVATAYTNGSTWGQAFTIDPWGNLTAVTAVSGTTPVGVFTATATTKNQLTCTAGCSSSYDAAGNMLTDGNGGITYDAENRILTAGGVTYTYDGDGKRVEKSNGTLYWNGIGSDVLSESNLSGTITEDYIYFNGKLASRIDRPSGTVNSFLVDHLGSSRMLVVASGTNTLRTEEDLDYTPFGIVAYGTPADPHEFTGKERDSESGNDYFGARYYASTMGRFLTPDSARYSGLNDPQSLNLYSYVGNHPTFLIDPEGRCWQWAQKLCDAAKNVGQRFDNLFHGEGFRTDQGVENYAHQHNAERRQQEVNGSTAGRLGQRYGEFHRNWDRWWAAHDCENSMGGCGLAPSLASLGVYTRPTRTLFRAVSRAEFEDIQKTGKFSASPGGAESKYFYPTLDQAEKMGERMYGEDYGVVVGNFPESAVEGPFPVATEGDVYTVPNENLELARPAVEVPLDTPEIPE
jgi:RHS repeat-associated protein